VDSKYIESIYYYQIILNIILSQKISESLGNCEYLRNLEFIKNLESPEHFENISSLSYVIILSFIHSNFCALYQESNFRHQ